MKSNPLKLRKGAWAPEEDNLLRKCIEKYGEGKWHLVPHRAGLNRCRKSCRLRWLNYLRPCIKRGEFAEDEVDLIMRLHKLLGNRWSLIAGRLPGRTANDVKNYWNTNLQKKSRVTSCSKEAGESKEDARETRVIRPRPRNLFKGTSVPCYSAPNNNFSTAAGGYMLIDDKPLSLATPADEDGMEWWKNLLDEVGVSREEDEDEDESGDMLMRSTGGSHNMNLDAETSLLWRDSLSAVATKSTSSVSKADDQNGWGDIWDILNADNS